MGKRYKRYIVEVRASYPFGYDWEFLWSTDDENDAVCGVHEEEIEDRVNHANNVYRIVDTVTDEVVYG